jgi:rod shape determining protein RodA
MRDTPLSIAILFLLTLSVFVLKSIAPSLFPSYFVYLIFALLGYWLFSRIGFDITSLFSKHFYIVSIILLLLTLVIGRATRGTIRWIPIGGFTLQPAELVRPFLLVFFANILTQKEVKLKFLYKVLLLLALPVVLILIQPSLGVTVLTVVGFVGILFASDFNKKYLLTGVGAIILALPLLWFIMAPYQKARLTSFIDPEKDPSGSGYNSLQSTIAAGSGKLTGRGLGRGVQTQLSFLPEKQTDFIFAATGEELGFVGSGLMLSATFVILWRLTVFMENSISPAGRAYLSGFLLTYFVQVFVHVAMNMGLMPITGLPYPLVSAGGSSLLATMVGLGIAVGAYKR